MTIEGTKLQAWHGTEIVAEILLDQPSSDLPSVVLSESDKIAFEINPKEIGREYEILVGDIPLIQGHHGRKVVEWNDNAYFDSARGQTPVLLRSKDVDGPEDIWTVRARFDAWVCPGKLTESAYQRMFDDLAVLSSGLVFDLLSKSRFSMASLRGMRSGAVAARSAQMELRLMSQLWSGFSKALVAIITQPETSLITHRAMMACHGTERLDPKELIQIVTRGIDPRQKETPRPFTAELTQLRHSIDTHEHRIIAAFLDVLSGRIRECYEKARLEISEIEQDRWFRDRVGPGGLNLFETMDAPRIARLDSAATTADDLAKKVRMAQQLFPLKGLSDQFRAEASTPIFRNVRHYRQAWQIMMDYKNSSTVTVDSGTEERTKQTWRMYEQWVFLQIAAAFRNSGLRCSSQRDFINAVSKNRFTVDLQRDTRIVFAAPDGHRIVMRYEPWIFSRQIADGKGDTVYQGNDNDVPWSPDILIEFLKPSAEGGIQLVYAIVVDAKYARYPRNEHWSQVQKYMRIRSVATNDAIVRQVWLALPNQNGIVLDDDAIDWTPSGPSVSRHEFLLGALGIGPLSEEPTDAEGNSAATTVQEFADGLLAYLGLGHQASKQSAIQ
jgi:hypothetical protein